MSSVKLKYFEQKQNKLSAKQAFEKDCFCMYNCPLAPLARVMRCQPHPGHVYMSVRRLFVAKFFLFFFCQAVNV